jgi:hypothetical protein
VIVIEHHLSVIAHADWVIDLGPGAGHAGGRVVFEGPPADLGAARSPLTGEHLAAVVESGFRPASHFGRPCADHDGALASPTEGDDFRPALKSSTFRRPAE